MLPRRNRVEHAAALERALKLAPQRTLGASRTHVPTDVQRVLLGGHRVALYVNPARRRPRARPRPVSRLDSPSPSGEACSLRCSDSIKGSQGGVGAGVVLSGKRAETGGGVAATRRPGLASVQAASSMGRAVTSESGAEFARLGVAAGSESIAPFPRGQRSAPSLSGSFSGRRRAVHGPFGPFRGAPAAAARVSAPMPRG
jgi:hypothetical protein